MVSKPEHHLGERFLHRHRRVIRSDERIDYEALARGEAELELPDPSPEPEREGREPWGFADESRMDDNDRERLRLYRAFLAEREGGDE